MADTDKKHESKLTPPKIEILDKAPSSIKRPLTLLNGVSYAATWLYTKVIDERPTEGEEDEEIQDSQVDFRRPLFIVRNDGILFSEQPGDICTPLTYLGAQIKLSEMPRPEKIWSSLGVKRYLAGNRPSPQDVFGRVTEIVDFFIDFERSLTTQSEMAELIACYVLATWFLDAFTVIGYLWPNGERGSGKTQLLALVAELAYLGELILAGGSYASLRDLADYGATLAFDDAENLTNPNYTDLDKRALLLAGNRRGSVVSLKERVGKIWKTRYVNTYCPRLFSAISLPDPVLASRAIVIPLIRTPDGQRANSDPLEYDLWPHDRRKILDDLWALGLSRLPELPAYERKVNQRARLRGRNLEPWRAILAVALWLDDNGVSGIWNRMEELSWKYHTDEQSRLQTGDLTHLVILALIECAISANKANSAISNVWYFPTKVITARTVEIAKDEEADLEVNKITSRVVGRSLGKMRFKPRRPDSSKPRGWLITRNELERWCLSYGIQFPTTLNTQQDNGTNGIDGINGTQKPTSLENEVVPSDIPEVTKPCYACGGKNWKSCSDGDGIFCGTCHP